MAKEKFNNKVSEAIDRLKSSKQHIYQNQARALDSGQLGLSESCNFAQRLFECESVCQRPAAGGWQLEAGSWRLQRAFWPRTCAQRLPWRRSLEKKELKIARCFWLSGSEGANWLDFFSLFFFFFSFFISSIPLLPHSVENTVAKLMQGRPRKISFPPKSHMEHLEDTHIWVDLNNFLYSFFYFPFAYFPFLSVIFQTISSSYFFFFFFVLSRSVPGDLGF